MKCLFLCLYFAFSTAQLLYAQDRVCLPRQADNAGFGFPAHAVDSFLQLQQYKIVLFGEQHNNRIDPEIKYHIITHLHKTYGYRHVFMETGYAAAWLTNQYVNTGDTTLYKGRGNYKLYLDKIYAYNKSLPPNQRIVFHGVDFERVEVFRVINALAPQGESVPPTLKPAMDTVKAHLADASLIMYSVNNGKMTLNDNSAFENTLRWLQGQFEMHATDSRAYFGDNYKTLEGIAGNRSPVEVRPFKRNRTMFRNMKHTVEQEKIDKFIGFFGNMHTSYKYGSSLSNAVKRLPHVSGKDVLNIAEALYNNRDDGGQLQKVDNIEILKTLNSNCRATFLKVADVQGFKGEADFVLVADYE